MIGKHVRRSIFVVMVLSQVGCRLLDPDRAMVARVGDERLTVAGLAETISRWDTRPKEPDFVERYVRQWIDLHLFVDRLAVGDSMLDRETVLAARWPDVHQVVIADFQMQLFAEHMPFDSARVDSIYDAGDLRTIWYSFFRMSPEMTPAETRAQLEAAERMRDRLRQCGVWGEVMNHNEDGQVRLIGGGNLVLFARGETEPAFDGAAFALEPGGLSDLTPTRSGLNLIYRPRLDEVRDEFAQWAERAIGTEFDSVYAERLLETGAMEVGTAGIEKAREVAEFPIRHIDGDEVIATYRGGEITAGRLVQWLQYLPASMNHGMIDATDERVREMLEGIVSRELLWRQADSAGFQVTDSVLTWIRGRHRASLVRTWDALDLAPETLGAAAPSAAERRQVAHDRIAEFIDTGPGRNGALPSVQPFLAVKLRREGDWALARSGLGPVIERALRLVEESAN